MTNVQRRQFSGFYEFIFGILQENKGSFYYTKLYVTILVSMLKKTQKTHIAQEGKNEKFRAYQSAISYLFPRKYTINLNIGV